MIEVLKVSSKSNPNAVAGALAGVIRASGSVEIQVVGAGALNQAIKAAAIARGYLTPSGIDLVCTPTFADIMIDGERRTAIRLQCDHRASPRSVRSIDLTATDALGAPPAEAALVPDAPATAALLPSSS